MEVRLRWFVYNALPIYFTFFVEGIFLVTVPMMIYTMALSL